MRIVAKKMVTDFGNENAQAKEELAIWYAILEHADWNSPNDLKADFPTADYVGDNRWIFNVKGNHYRVIAMIFFPPKRIYLRGIYTHANYSKLTKKDILVL